MLRLRRRDFLSLDLSGRLRLFFSSSLIFFSGLDSDDLSDFFLVVAVFDAELVEDFLTIADFLGTGEDTLRALAELLTAFLRSASASYASLVSVELK